ncbi:MAG: class I SAM-dependent methyltransferase [Phycisphaerales bacterium]|nr:MAG: class I SAM-dependent methyltransferase [Phycisphaerales bacterium]
MSAPISNQIDYWEREGPSKSFHHPVDFEMLDSYATTQDCVLDYGCGHGRVAAILHDHGYRDVVGLDFSARMIESGRAAHPYLDLRVVTPPDIPFEASSFDLVVLFTVLTCIAEDQAQVQLISELTRLLRPDGLLYISDLLLQDDERNLARYRASAEGFATYGAFELCEGVVMRHHSREWIDTLLLGYRRLAYKELTVTTMNGHSAKAFQWLGRKVGPEQGRDA